MKDKIVNFVYICLSLVFMWLLVNYWLPQGYVIAGHDSGLAVNAKNFLETRLFAWDPQGFGSDNSTHFGSLTIHFMDYVSSVVAGTTEAGNKVLVFFWLGSIFTSGYILASSLRKYLGKHFHFLFPVFVTFNFLILQSIFILERAKYSLLVALMLFLTIYIRIRENKISLPKGIILTSLVFFIFNCGSWLGLPLYGSVLVVVGSLFVYEIFSFWKTKSLEHIKRLVIYYISVLVVFIILNSYSIFPYVSTFLGKDLAVLTGGEVTTQNLSWLRSISQAGSFMNIFRLQGVPDWYSGYDEVNLGHSYAQLYLQNPFLVIVSLFFPILAVLSLVLAKTKNETKYLYLFGLVTIVSMPFMAGSHAPLGGVYELLYKTIPGFSIFRSPFYKFGSAFYIGITVLMSFTFSKLVCFLSNKTKKYQKLFTILLILGVIFGWLGYYKVIFFPEQIFTWQKGLSTKVQIPSYVEEFELDSQSLDLTKRTLLLPANNYTWTNDAYFWGYWSLTNLPSSVSKDSFLTNSGNLTSESRQWVNKLYELIDQKNEDEFIRVAQHLYVGQILLRKDVLSDSSWSASDDPDTYEKILKGFTKISKIKDYGQWTLYEIPGSEQKFTTVNSLVVIPNQNLYPDISFLNSDGIAAIEEISQGVDFSEFSLTKYVISNRCQSCDLEDRPESVVPIISITPDSLLYVFKELREAKTLKNISSEGERISAYLGFSLRRASETRRMWDFNSGDKYIASNLQKMSEYLDNIYDIIQKTSDPEKDFVTSKQMFTYLESVESILNPLIDRLDSYPKERAKVKTEVLNLLWNVEKIRKYYDPIYSDETKWDTNKVFTLNLGDINTLGVDKKTLPTNLDGSYIYPYSIIYEDGRESVLKFDEDSDFIYFDIDSNKQGNQNITLRFKDLPNLYQDKRLVTETTPKGDVSCELGKISSVKPGSNYRILVYPQDVNQQLHLYIEESQLFKANPFFLRGNQESSIYPLLISKPYTFLYRPLTPEMNPDLYFCNQTKDSPKISKIEIHQIFFPSIVFKQEINVVNQKALPDLEIKNIDPTKYVVNVHSSTYPYVLIFNEQYNGLWKAKIDKNTIDEKNHIKVNGYVNGWKVDKVGDYQIVIEYIPQKSFYIGSLVTVVSFAFLLSFYVYMDLKNRKNNKK